MTNSAFSAAFVPYTPISVMPIFLPGTSDVVAPATPCTSRTDVASALPPLSGPPADTAKLVELGRLYEEARRERRSGNFSRAAITYGQILLTIESSFDPQGDTSPLYMRLPRGGALFAEAVLEGAALSGPEDAVNNLARLSRLISQPPPGADTPLDLAKAELLKAYVLMGHASRAHVPQAKLYGNALLLVERAIQRVLQENSEIRDDFKFYAGLLKVEILSRQMELAHIRRDFKSRKTFLDQIRETLNQLTAIARSPEMIAVLAEYQADIAIFKGRIGMWGAALERARTVASKPFDTTPAANRLLEHKIFAAFVDGRRVLSPSEIKLRSGNAGWLKRLQAALAFAHSESFGQTIKAGGIGCTAGMIANFAGHGDHLIMAGVLGAAIFSGINRIRNGWRTEEAFYAKEIGTFERSAGERARDIANLAVQGGFDMLAWAVPTALVHAGAPGIEVAANTLGNAGLMYARFGGWLAAGLASLVEPHTQVLQHLPANAWYIAYNLYTKSAGALFTANLLFPSMRKYTDALAIYFLPGAVMLSADIGMAIAGESPLDLTPHFLAPAYFDRIKRVLIVSGEIFMMMLVSGILSIESKKTKTNIARSVLKNFSPARANYMLPLAAVITNGISSPLGGMMQRGVKLDDPVLIAMQGAAITFAILPITLAVSGVLKGNIPIFDGAKEAWEDFVGSPLPRRLYESAAGALSAFNMPYAHNRIGRAGTFDIFPSGLRAFAGWDSNQGQLAMSATNFVSGNGSATSTWPEPSGTRWERDSLVRLTRAATGAIRLIDAKRCAGQIGDDGALSLERGATESLRDFFTKAGQVMHPAHLFLDHASLKDRLWPLRSATRPFRSPTFPHRPATYLFANLYQILHGGHRETLAADELNTILKYVRIDARDPDAFHVIRPLVQTLALSRDSAEFGDRIGNFFTDNSWIPEVLDIDLDDFKPLAHGPRRFRRAIVRRALAMSFDDYQGRVALHGRVSEANSRFEGLFTTSH